MAFLYYTFNLDKTYTFYQKLKSGLKISVGLFFVEKYNGSPPSL